MPDQIIYLHYNDEGLPTNLSEEVKSIDYNKQTLSGLKESLLSTKGIIIPKDSSSKNLDALIISTIRHQFKLKHPILVISDEKMDSWFEINSSELPEYLRYLQDPSISYLTKSEFLQISEKDLVKHFEEGLDDILLNELCSYLYDDFGYMIYRLNELKSNIQKEKDINKVNSLQERYFHELKCILERNMNFLEKGDEYLVQILNQLNKEIKKSHELIQSQIVELIRSMEDYSHFLMHEERKFELREKGEVLFIGNSRDRIRQIEDHFFSQGVICRGTSCPNKVIEMLKSEKGNKVTVVISESRFYSERKKIQRKQLQHLNKIIGSLPNIISMVVLTESDVSIFQNSHISNICIQKNLIFDHPNGLQRLSNAFFELDREVRSIINNLPGFNDQQKVLYKKHKESHDYFNVERELSQIAEAIVSSLIAGRSAVELDLPALNGKLNNKNAVKNLENFRKVLLARRIAIGLCQIEEETLKSNYPSINKNLTNIERWGIIYNALKYGSLRLQGNELPDEAEISTVIIRNLKLSLKSRYKCFSGLQGRLTQEERVWVKEFREEVSLEKQREGNGLLLKIG